MGGAVQAASDTLQRVGDVATQTAKNIINNPLPTIATAILISQGVPAPIATATVTYLNGGSTEDAIRAGAISYAGQQAGQYAASEYGVPLEYGTDVGSEQSAMLAAQDAGMPTVTESAVGGAASGATQAALRGENIGDILTAGAKGGLVSGGSEYISQEAGMQPGSTGEFITKTASSKALSDILSGPKPTSPTAPTPAYGTYPTSVTTTGAGASPGSAALAQALRTDLGAPIFGGDKDKAPRKSGWNVESLRYMGNTGEA